MRLHTDELRGAQPLLWSGAFGVRHDAQLRNVRGGGERHRHLQCGHLSDRFVQCLLRQL
jgi:hypothetical protein